MDSVVLLHLKAANSLSVDLLLTSVWVMFRYVINAASEVWPVKARNSPNCNTPKLYMLVAKDRRAVWNDTISLRFFV